MPNRIVINFVLKQDGDQNRPSHSIDLARTICITSDKIYYVNFLVLSLLAALQTSDNCSATPSRPKKTRNTPSWGFIQFRIFYHI
jgi:hypothetical protein